MLHALIFLIIFVVCSQFRCAWALKSNTIQFDLKNFINESYQKAEEILLTPDFQSFVKNQKIKSVENIQKANLPFQGKGALYVFVSFSIGEKGLHSIAEQAKRCGAYLVLRGFKEGSYKKTVEALQKITLKTGQGFTIDPELFETFQIDAVPTIILASLPRIQEDAKLTPLHDRIAGNVTLTYALETFKKGGDLKELATSYLMRRKLQ